MLYCCIEDCVQQSFQTKKFKRKKIQNIQIERKSFIENNIFTSCMDK